ncbi:MAG: nicotinate-nucleotide--dimethylbenzimidazole phosphoribosyltransferase [Candidatus Rokuibacteriota bacterium]|nr:MAG: nicotinate-nucleotide--dimethylbenzimidazole phosphoribosyltransferase [Candidatus Rokubacteria bacterium]PYO05011.1 MAG: nicotinate-nucleotide--dimethylbenzimidazole phosphoribosyltransferase [Candidatus Rokubacteria bacterium]
MTGLSRLLASIAPPSRDGESAARRHLDSLTKPPGSLGRLEEIALRLAVLRGRAPEVARPVIFTFAADHGVVAEGVSAYPQVVTAQMVENFTRGGAAVNVLARQAGARVVVADFGVATPLERAPDLVECPIGPGTANIAAGPAMTREHAIRAIETGARLAQEAMDAGADLLATGEMGIGNTTAASAITAAITGAPAEQVTGRGTGVDEATLTRKVAAVRRALEVNRPDPRDGLDVLAKVGGFEIGGLTGVILAGAARRVPVALDGFIAGSAALLAVTLAPDSRHALFASHRSAEPGHAHALEHMGLEPYLDLGLRLGEGTGAALFIHLARAAALVWSEMATFKAAGVSESPEAGGQPR